GLDDRTVVVFTSDNGGLSIREGPNTPSTNNFPLREGKGYLYEGGIRVPWIVAGPVVAKPGTTCDVPICSIDLLPTLLELAEVPAPRGVELDGVSLVPLLRGGSSLSREVLYWHYPHYILPGIPPSAAIRHGNDKLVEFFEDGRTELYDLKLDP